MMKEGWKVDEVRKELDLLPSDLRALVMVFKRMGIGVHRSNGKFIIRELPKQEVILRTPVDLVMATVQATKILRFIYGENVTLVWPNAVALGKDVIAKVEGPSLRVKGLDKYLEGAIIKQTRDSLRRKKLGETMRIANVMLYKDQYKFFLKNGEAVKARVELVNLSGRARTSIGELRVEDVNGIEL